MASKRERTPGVWELKAYVGRDHHGREKYRTRRFRGGARDAEIFVDDDEVEAVGARVAFEGVALRLRALVLLVGGHADVADGAMDRP